MKLIIHKEVDLFIEKLQKFTQSKWLRQLILLEQYGEHLGMPHVRHMNGGMRELRVRGSQEIRALFVLKDDKAIIAHAFMKKSQKISQREIDTARERISNLLTEI